MASSSPWQGRSSAETDAFPDGEISRHLQSGGEQPLPRDAGHTSPSPGAQHLSARRQPEGDCGAHLGPRGPALMPRRAPGLFAGAKQMRPVAARRAPNSWCYCRCRLEGPRKGRGAVRAQDAEGVSERGSDTRLLASASCPGLAVSLALHQLLPSPWIRIDGLSSNGPVKNANL